MISANANTTVTDMQLTAVQYMERGWSPIPILFKQKKPGFNNVLLHDWNRYEFNAHHFEGQSNIGIKLGEPSGGLVDIDLGLSRGCSAGGAFPTTHGGSVRSQY